MKELTFIDELTGLKIVVKDDFMSYCYVDGHKPTPFYVMFPKCSINWHSGYIVKEDGTIVCSLEANTYIAQFDGCVEASIQIY